MQSDMPNNRSDDQPSEYSHWRLRVDEDGIAWLSMDRAGERVNTLSEETLTELDQILDRLMQSPPTGLIINSAKEAGFIAGADIREFESFTDPDSITEKVLRGQAVFHKLEKLSCISVAAVDGHCLGGGYELALACNYIIATDADDTRIGLPEVQLGILPGLGGTVRLTERVGGMNGMTAILTGKMHRARQAKSLGMVDEIVGPHANLRWAARRAVIKKRKFKGASRSARLTNSKPARNLLAGQMVKKTKKKANPDHYPGPYKIIDLWKEHRDNRDNMFEAEAKQIGELMVSSEARGLQRVFHLMERLKGLGKNDQYKCRRVHVIGAGVMGGDIAAWCALQGMEVTVQDREMQYIEPAVARAKKLFKRKTRSKHDATATLARFRPDVKSEGVARADVIIEAIFENKEAKQELYKDIEPRMRDDAVLATNTSAIPLEELSSVLKNPQRLIGLHFFNPVAKMPLVEVVHADNTSKDMIDRGLAFCAGINRFPLPVKSSPGFLVNRVLAAYMLEAMNIHDEGVPIGSIDAAATHFGMPMGPIELADTVGLDICKSVVTTVGNKDVSKAVDRLTGMVDDGMLGKKSGQGFYQWSNDKPVRDTSESEADRSDDHSQSDSDLEQLTERLMKPFLDECKACSADGIVEDDDLLDAGIIFGTGFAPFRGGPMHYMKGLS